MSALIGDRVFTFEHDQVCKSHTLQHMELCRLQKIVLIVLDGIFNFFKTEAGKYSSRFPVPWIP